MFDEADPPRRRTDALAELAREDLDKLSVADLDDRIAVLKAELARTETKRGAAAAFKSAADALFKK